jgi:hypothetical protein
MSRPVSEWMSQNIKKIQKPSIPKSHNTSISIPSIAWCLEIFSSPVQRDTCSSPNLPSQTTNKTKDEVPSLRIFYPSTLRPLNNKSLPPSEQMSRPNLFQPLALTSSNSIYQMNRPLSTKYPLRKVTTCYRIRNLYWWSLVGVIVHAADSTNPELALPLIKALEKQKESAGKPTYFIHVGSSVDPSMTSDIRRPQDWVHSTQTQAGHAPSTKIQMRYSRRRRSLQTHIPFER